MQRKLCWSLMVVAAVALLACSGDDDGVSLSTPSSTANDAARSGAASTATPRSPADDFTAVLNQLAGAEYRITYTFTSTTSGEEFTGALTWIRAADGRERFETSSEQGDEQFRLVVITDPVEGQISCFDVGGFASCFRGADGPFADLPNPTEIVFQNILDPGRIDGVRVTASRDILGVRATCYEVDANGGTSDACISEGGLLLAATWTASGGDGGSLEATEFSTEVLDADFEPTAPIADS